MLVLLAALLGPVLADNRIRQAPVVTLTPSVTCDCRTVMAAPPPQTVWKTETVPAATGSVIEWTSWTHWTSSWTLAPEPVTAPAPTSTATAPSCPERCKCADITDIVSKFQCWTDPNCERCRGNVPPRRNV
ncbi:hypothetical protein GGTG_08854 [Gaeumannomyces tritici R3-111a-1]|uniref:Uncharacterized protein n=1 Tax=Gaeumannomyces tritici (strain R3-111a-1) TaxID=644352 RepID=J3P5R4_GAET3|nr:hypothetical protein GGTG_08854 [Gaeumannomyces tritici R3-111a-1]EJT75016.1 hypothetical protein GGTG_08854 [Gaeumannomyces tritici R3-111a-1]